MCVWFVPLCGAVLLRAYGRKYIGIHKEEFPLEKKICFCPSLPSKTINRKNKNLFRKKVVKGVSLPLPNGSVFEKTFTNPFVRVRPFQLGRKKPPHGPPGYFLVLPLLVLLLNALFFWIKKTFFMIFGGGFVFPKNLFMLRFFFFL